MVSQGKKETNLGTKTETTQPDFFIFFLISGNPMFNNPNLLISGLVLLGFSVKSGAFFLKRGLTFYVEVFILWQVMPSWVEKGVSKANISLAVLATNTWLLMHCQILLPST